MPEPASPLDADLRWLLVTRLAALGALGEAEIAAEKALDPTAAGDRHAAAAMAARPDPAAKAEAWAAVVESSALPNAVQGAMIGGFAQHSQRALLRPYVERYLTAVEHVWEARTSEMAQQIVVGLFPNLLPEPEVIAAVDAWLASTCAAPACAGSCSRAATAWPGRCGRASATPASPADPGQVPDGTSPRLPRGAGARSRGGRVRRCRGAGPRPTAAG